MHSKYSNNIAANDIHFKGLTSNMKRLVNIMSPDTSWLIKVSCSLKHYFNSKDITPGPPKTARYCRTLVRKFQRLLPPNYSLSPYARWANYSVSNFLLMCVPSLFLCLMVSPFFFFSCLKRPFVLSRWITIKTNKSQ